MTKQNLSTDLSAEAPRTKAEALAKVENKKRIIKLRKEIEYHRNLYHILDKQEISDAALDSLKHELLKLEEKYPEFVTLDSPTQRIGGKVLEKFVKTKHKARQWSLEDAFTEKEIRDWDKRIKKWLLQKTGEKFPSISYSTELKIDGIHIVLTYKQGLLTMGATRGNGQTGENITNNVRTIGAIPLKLKEKLNLVVEGEIFIRKTVFQEINRIRKENGETLLANPRNASAGAIRQLDPAITRKRHLDFFAYDISWPENNVPKGQFEELQKLKKLEFKVNEHIILTKNIDEVIKIWEDWSKKKEKEDYWIDGLVAKVNLRQYQLTLGFRGKSPRWAIALKYPGEEATTIIDDIKLSVGRTGKITPIAIFNPVKIAGTIVSRASLHNMDEIKRLDIRIGDTAIIHKAGDIIPQVKRILKNLRPKNACFFKLSLKCPSCGSKIVKPAGEVNYYCSNQHCGDLSRRRIHYFVSKNGFDIDGMGPKIADQLISAGLISNPADIFKLEKGDIELTERFAEKSALNLIQAINKSKKISFHKFFTALGIKHIGNEMVLLIEQGLCGKYGRFDSIDKILKIFPMLKKEEIEMIKGAGLKVAESLIDFFQNKVNLEMMADLKKNGVEIISEKRKKAILRRKTFVFTGSLNSVTRDDAKKTIINLGGKTSELISKKTNFLVVGKNPGSKYNKAKKLGIKRINENKFLRLIKQE